MMGGKARSAIAVLLASLASSSSGFVVTPNGKPSVVGRLHHATASSRLRASSNWDGVDDGSVDDVTSKSSSAKRVRSSSSKRPTDDPTLMSPRTARVRMPLASLLATFASTGAAPLPAAALISADQFDASRERYFPLSMRNSAVVRGVSNVIKSRGYELGKTLLGSSVCSDEVNDTPQSLVTRLQQEFTTGEDGGVFNLGGLGGLPFVGTVGFGAFISHCPDQGRVLIAFGPHVGISNGGVVGKVERIGVEKPSTSCGAAVGAYKAIAAGKAGGAAPPVGTKKGIDFEEQEDYIVAKLKDRLEDLAAMEARGNDATITFVTNKMYELVYELLKYEVNDYTEKDGFWDKVSEITLLGGIVINRGHGPNLVGGEDFFEPLTLKSITREGETDLYREAFPNLIGFDASRKRYFPGSLKNAGVLARVSAVLKDRGYTSENTILGSSLCSDEINDTPNSLIAGLQRKFTAGEDGGIFNLGGLGGLPFVGTTGMGAFVSHTPDNGNVIIVFAPHVGISKDGVVGKVERVGKTKPSGSCGAALGAYKALKSGGPVNFPDDDFQEAYIVENLEKKLGSLAAVEAKGDDGAIAYVTEKMYDLVYELLQPEVEAYTSKADFWNSVNEVTLLGGVVINRGHGASGLEGGNDYFQPLVFKSINKDGETNLYDKAFGAEGELLYEEIFGEAPTPPPPAPAAIETTPKAAPVVVQTPSAPATAPAAGGGAVEPAAGGGGGGLLDNALFTGSLVGGLGGVAISTLLNQGGEDSSASGVVTAPVQTSVSGKTFAQAPKGVPTLRNWKQNRNGTVTGLVSGLAGYDQDDLITTSVIASGEFKSGSIVTTSSGSQYFLT